ncbi:DUF5641 domain-containing protein [Trichonephila clavipes]|nr:DUF5641 domain-containing protein [Trichonephila clavipes]
MVWWLVGEDGSQYQVDSTKVLARTCVTYEEILTLLCECESILNGRPLTHVSDVPNDMTYITPAHFIQDNRASEKECLGELVRNSKSTSKRKEVTVREILLIGSDNSKRLNWPLGRVIEVYPGKDGCDESVRNLSTNLLRRLFEKYKFAYISNQLQEDKRDKQSR